jgi:hypothetical protein
MAKQLLSDFRGIEQNFREVAENVQKAHLESNISKGSVMGQVLNEYESLRNSDQGRSFYAFFDFLISDIHQQELESLRLFRHLVVKCSCRYSLLNGV